MHQKITMNIPGGGRANNNLSMVIKRPHGPVKQKRFKSLKDAMSYLKEQTDNEYEG